MSEDNPMRVKICEHGGKTSIYIDAEITDDGHFLLCGQDVGEAPSSHWGDRDYEYWVLVDAAEKDRLLLALMQKLYAGNTSASSEFMDFLKAAGIPYRFDTYA